MTDRLVAYFLHDQVLRSRSVSPVVHTATLNVPAPSARLLADWERETSVNLKLAPGDVEQLSLLRARTHWPDVRRCVQPATDWARILGLPAALLADSDIALMTCRGARYHHDGAQYGGAAFLNLFLSADKGLDLHFPQSGHRIPLTQGTAVLFDTGQPHAVIPRGSARFDAADFPSSLDCTVVFLTWELAVEHIGVTRALGITFEVDLAGAATLDEEQIRLGGTRCGVSPATGRWIDDAGKPAKLSVPTST